MIHGWCREGYTIGYYGRIFKAKNGVKGGAFDAETEFERFVVGAGTIVPGLEQGILSMRVGGIRQIVIPAEIGYPLDDPPHDKVGPKPPNFDGQRALNFVLYNQGLIDKTLLFNVKLIRIDTSNGKGGFTRGVVQASSAGKASPKPVEEDEDEEWSFENAQTAPTRTALLGTVRMRTKQQAGWRGKGGWGWGREREGGQHIFGVIEKIDNKVMWNLPIYLLVGVNQFWLTLLKISTWARGGAIGLLLYGYVLPHIHGRLSHSSMNQLSHSSMN